jgi:hypothetical protein
MLIKDGIVLLIIYVNFFFLIPRFYKKKEVGVILCRVTGTGYYFHAAGLLLG